MSQQGGWHGQNYPAAYYPQQMAPQWRCPFCGATMPPHWATKTPGSAWVIAVLIFLFIPFLGWVTFWIPLVAMKERYRQCSHCYSRVG